MIRRVAAGIGMTVFDKLVVAATQLALVPILATHWGLALYGQWLLLATLPQFLSMSDFGFATAAGTRMTMAAARGDREEAIRIFQSAWRAILVSSAGMIALALTAAWFLPDSVLGGAAAAPGENLRLTLAILAVYGVAAVQGSIFFAGFRAAQLFPVGAFWNAMVLLIENGALVITVLLGGGMVAAASAWLCGRLVGLFVQNWLLRRRVPWLRIGLARGSWAEARALLAPAGAVMLLPIAQALVLQGMALVVGAAAGRAAVPAFAAGRTLSRVGMQLCWVVSTPLMPEFSAALARRDGARMAAMIGATLLVSALLVVPYALVFMGLGQMMIATWTHGAILAPRSLVIAFGFTVMLGGIWYPLSNLLLASDRQAGYSIWYVALAALCLPIGYASTVRFGASSAAVTMAALDLVMLLIVARLARRLFGPQVDMAAALSTLRRWVATVTRVGDKRASR